MAYGYAYALIGDAHLAEDAAQEAFVVAWRKLADVRNAEAFPGWFRRVVRTQCDRLTRGKRLPTVPLEAASQVCSKDPRPDVYVETQETRARISGAIRSLPEAERVATTLYYLDGHTQKEMARFLGINPAAVSTRLYSARQRLKGRLTHMVRDDVRGTRPSRDEAFVRDVLFRSIQEGDAEKVRQLVGSDASLLGASDKQGRTPIEALSKSEHPNTVRRDFDKRRAIYDFLTERGASADLPVAIAMNDVALVEALIASHPEQIDAPLTAPTPAYGMRRLRMRPLAIAIAFHREEIARMLLTAGADVHADNDQAAVIAATVPAHLLSTLRLLMDHGAQPDPYPGAPYGPLASACEWLEAESAWTLIEAGADPNGPIYAEYAGNMVERFMGLVPHDGPDAPEEYPMEWLRPAAEPMAPLFVALGSPAGYCVDWDGLPRVVEALLDAGADVRQEISVLTNGERVDITPLAYLRDLTENLGETERRHRNRGDQTPHNLSHPDNWRLVEETVALLLRHGATR